MSRNRWERVGRRQRDPAERDGLEPVRRDSHLEAEGYRFNRVIDVLPWQHILVFRR